MVNDIVPLNATQLERFHSKISRGGEDACWLWMGIKLPKGYGVVPYAHAKRIYAHRLAWILANQRPIPHSMLVCHKCDNPSCCNPAHLFIGTHRDNARDMVSKKRSCIGEKNALSKLDDAKVLEIRSLLSAGASSRSVSRKFGLSAATIGKICRGETWRHLGGRIRYGRLRGANAPQSINDPVLFARIEVLLPTGMSQRAIGRALGINHKIVMKIADGTHWSKRKTP